MRGPPEGGAPLLAPGWNAGRRGDRLRDHRGLFQFFALGVVGTLFGIFVCAMLWGNYREDRVLVATGERVTARVESTDEGLLFIAVPVTDGRVVRTSVAIDPGSEVPERTVEVAYDPSDPTAVARVDAAGNEPWVIALGVALLIGLPLSIAAYSLWAWGKLRRALDPARRRVERAWACVRTVETRPPYSTISIFERPDETGTRLVADTWPGDVLDELDMVPVTLEGDIRVGGAGTLTLEGGRLATLQGFRRPRLSRRRRPRPLAAP